MQQQQQQNGTFGHNDVRVQALVRQFSKCKGTSDTYKEGVADLSHDARVMLDKSVQQMTQQCQM